MVDNGNGVATITGVNAGTTQIDYVLNGVKATKIITVNTLPAIPYVYYAPGGTNPQAGAPAGSYCRNRNFSLVGSPSGGSWSSAGVASVNNFGNVTFGSSTGFGSITYTFTNASGCSSNRTLSGNIVACASKGASDLAKESNFIIYPNPAKTVVNLKLDHVIGKVELIITDLLGKQVKNQLLSIGNNAININNLTKGMYLVNIKTEQGVKTQKIIVE